MLSRYNLMHHAQSCALEKKKPEVNYDLLLSFHTIVLSARIFLSTGNSSICQIPMQHRFYIYSTYIRNFSDLGKIFLFSSSFLMS